MEKESISTLLKQARLRKGLRQLELAELAGCSHATVQRCEKGTLDVSKATAEALAPHLDLPQNKLVELAFIETDIAKLKRVYRQYPDILGYLTSINGRKEELIRDLSRY